MSINKKLFRSGPYKDLFSQGVQVGNILYLSGQVGVDAKGQAGEDLTAQATLAYASIKSVLAEFGASMDNIVDETFFVTDMGEFMGSVESLYTARAEAYGGTPEVSQTVVQIVALVQPELKIEIKCVAHL